MKCSFVLAATVCLALALGLYSVFPEHAVSFQSEGMDYKACAEFMSLAAQPSSSHYKLNVSLGQASALVAESTGYRFESGYSKNCLLASIMVYTASGTNVPVYLNGGLNSAGGAEVIFSGVTSGGSTQLSATTSGPPPPTGFAIVGIGGKSIYYDIETSATYSGQVTVCIEYDQAQVRGPESGIKLMHWSGAEFLDVTSSLDTASNTVCGVTAALSPFIIAERAVPVGGVAELPDAAGASRGSSAPTALAVAGLATGAALLLAAGGWYARRRWLG